MTKNCAPQNDSVILRVCGRMGKENFHLVIGGNSVIFHVYKSGLDTPLPRHKQLTAEHKGREEVVVRTLE